MNLLQIHEPGQTPLPHEGGLAIGIDLGTTHSVAAVASGGVTTLLRDICGSALVPSVVFYGKDGVEVGKAARARLQRGEAGAIGSIKRLMGRSRAEAEALGFSDMLAQENQSSTGSQGMARLHISGHDLTAVEISAEILRHIKSLAGISLGTDITQAVITVPAYFDDAARQATKDAATLAGLEVLRLISEPTAAALAYGLDSGAEGIYAIYDLGGGTFDLSVLRLEKGVFQVLSTGGDLALGGDDFDRAIAAVISEKKQEDAALLYRARAVKEILSLEESATLEWQGKSYDFTRAQLEALMQPFLDRTLRISKQALEDARITPGEVKGVVLVGGSTRAPYVRSQVERFFGKKPLADINPDEVVAVGAAIQAEGLTRGSDNLLLDVVPLSLGLETMGGLVEKIIHRNTPIPVAAEQSFTTYKDGQDGMIIHVLQGEREMVDQNRSLARFELSGIPPLPAGIARVKVRFAVDADGLLSVNAREETTGMEQRVEVKPSYGLEPEEIERMLVVAMENARADITARLLAEARMEASRSMEELKSALARDGSMLEPAEAGTLREQMRVLENTCKGDDRDSIDAESERLHILARPFAERRMDRAIRSALKGAHVDDVANG